MKAVSLPIDCHAAVALASCCAALLSPSPAAADVMEIGSKGEARWIAGPLTGNGNAQDAGDTAAVPDLALIELARAAGTVPIAYTSKVAELAVRYDLSPALIEALVWQESRWHAGAVSPAGARGLAQLMPETARQLGVDSGDPMANLEGGARYLRAQIDHFGGDIEKALAAYNAGPGRVERAKGVPAIRETQDYVASVMGRLSDHARSDK